MSQLKLIEDRHMMTYRARLDSFQNWPFSEEDKCTPRKMAEAGFYACGDTREPDLARCYYCRKELDGWEPGDDPWEEHKSHVKGACAYINLNKKPHQITIKDAMSLEAERHASIVRKMTKERILQFREEVKDAKRGIEKMKH